MGEKTLLWVTLAVTFILGACSGFWFRGKRQVQPVEPVVKTDTLYLRDTIKIDRPVPVPKPVYLPSDTVRLVTVQHDTVHDTVEVLVPMEQKHYSDSLYDAWISGHRANLDSLHVYPVTKLITTTITVREKTKRWGIGPQIGVGLSPKGAAVPYVGVGISYNLIVF